MRIVYEGHLYPFGHRAALIKISERQIRTVGGYPLAYWGWTFSKHWWLELAA